MLDTDGQRYCDCCGVLLTDSNNTLGYEICDECDRRLEEKRFEKPQFEGTLELNSPISKEDWDKLTDVELEVSDHIWFTTPSGKRVDYVKADVLEQIQVDIYEHFMTIDGGVHDKSALKCMEIIDKYKAESEDEK